MPRFIVKPKPDEDFYVEWSTVVDAPVSYGQRIDFNHEPEERLDRADLNGSSCHEYDPQSPIRLAWYWWDKQNFLIHNGPGAVGMLTRADIRAYCEALGDEAKAGAMVTPLSRDEETE